jgi:hypothetical protein
MSLERKSDQTPERPNIEFLNRFALERVHQYLNLPIGNFKIRTPFFSNDIVVWFRDLMEEAGLSKGEVSKVLALYNEKKIPFGWYRGKGTPDQIASAAIEIARLWGLDLSNARNPETVVEFMKAAGLGVDCSGFVYQTLKYAFDQCGYGASFIESLNWNCPDDFRNEYRAKVEVFTGSASKTISPVNVRPLDIITIKSRDSNKYSHIALILGDEGNLVIAHSVIGQVPTGVHISEFKLEGSLPRFGFTPNLTEKWEELCESGRLEFRKLNLLDYD